MKMLVVLALAACAAAEPEADAQFLTYTTGVHTPLTYTAPVAVSPALTYTHHAVATPFVYNTAAVVPKVEVKAVEPAVEAVEEPVVKPVVYAAGVHTPYVYNSVYNPVVYNTAPVAAAVAPVVAPVAASHTVTSYNNPVHYTAVSNGAVGPKYIAKNHGVEHVVKREAEADPALLYTSAYGAYPYHTAYTYPYTTYATVAAKHVVPAAVAPVTYATKPVVAAPVAYNTVAAVAAAPALVKTPDHAVAYTAFGATHSSNVGVCTNVHGVQVPC